MKNCIGIFICMLTLTCIGQSQPEAWHAVFTSNPTAHVTRSDADIPRKNSDDYASHRLDNVRRSETSFSHHAVDSSILPSIYMQLVEFVTGSSVELNVGILANGPTGIFWFEWGEDTSYGNITPPQAFVAYNVGNWCQFLLRVPKVNTRYHVRPVAANDSGTTYGIDMDFVTLPDHRLSFLIALEADSVSKTSARIHARCNPNGTPTTVRFFYSPAIEHAIPFFTPPRDLGSGFEDIEISETVDGLIPGGTYSFYAGGLLSISSDKDYSLFGNKGFFSTVSDSTSKGLSITLQLATAEGFTPRLTFGVHTYATNCFDDALGEWSLPPVPPAGATEIRFTGPCLELGTYNNIRSFYSLSQIDTYNVHFQINDYNPFATLSWPDLSVAYEGKVTLWTPFETVDMKSQESYALNNPDFNVVRIFAERPNVNMSFPSIVMPDAADRPESNSVVALVKPNGHPTSAWFEWGVSMQYGNTSAQQFVGDGELLVKIQENFDSLTPYKVYHVRVAAENSTGRIYGPDQLLVVAKRSNAIPPILSPSVYALSQNYPNPFNPETKIEFQLAVRAVVTVKVYNTLGQEVATLADRRDFGEGKNTLNLDGANLPSGVYYYRIVAYDDQNFPLFTSVRKMLLVK